MRTLALVPARGGSKGVPGKNLRLLGGRSLLARAIDIGARTCGQVHVSTESGLIAVEATMHGAHVIQRPPELATDEAPMLGVVQHAVKAWDAMGLADVVVLLQPTQPLRTVDHVYAALMLLEETRADSVVSVVEIPAPYSPTYAVREEGGRLVAWEQPDGETLELDYMPTRRQDCEKAYARDGSVYVIRRDVIESFGAPWGPQGSLYGRRCVPLIIPPNESCNIDTEEDWLRAEGMVKE